MVVMQMSAATRKKKNGKTFATFWTITVVLNVWSWKLFKKLGDQFADVI